MIVSFSLVLSNLCEYLIMQTPAKACLEIKQFEKVKTIVSVFISFVVTFWVDKETKKQRWKTEM